MNAEFLKKFIGVAQDVDQCRDWSSLVAADVGNSALKQSLRHREDPLPFEIFAACLAKLVNLVAERSFRHAKFPRTLFYCCSRFQIIEAQTPR